MNSAWPLTVNFEHFNLWFKIWAKFIEGWIDPSAPVHSQGMSLLSLLNSCEIRHHLSRILARFLKLYSRQVSPKQVSTFFIASIENFWLERTVL